MSGRYRKKKTYYRKKKQTYRRKRSSLGYVKARVIARAPARGRSQRYSIRSGKRLSALGKFKKKYDARRRAIFNLDAHAKERKYWRPIKKMQYAFANRKSHERIMKKTLAAMRKYKRPQKVQLYKRTQRARRPWTNIPDPKRYKIIKGRVLNYYYNPRWAGSHRTISRADAVEALRIGFPRYDRR